MTEGVGIVELKKMKLNLPDGGLKLAYGGVLKEIEVAYEECGAPLDGKRKYCSLRCLKIATNREARRRYAVKHVNNRVVCLNCFEWFERKHSKQVYCSAKCRQEAEKKRGGTRKRKAAGIKRKESLLQKVCDECGEPFEATRKNHRFCSHKCAVKASRKKNKIEKEKTRQGEEIASIYYRSNGIVVVNFEKEITEEVVIVDGKKLIRRRRTTLWEITPGRKSSKSITYKKLPMTKKLQRAAENTITLLNAKKGAKI